MANSSKISDVTHVTLTDIELAAERVHDQAVLTPLLESHELNGRVGGRLLIKAEVLQRTGSFKFRGAYNAISQIPSNERRAGVVAFSSGNHAQGVAAATQLLGMPATIVMPADAPEIKVANTRAYGAEVVFFNREHDDRKAIACDIAEKTGATLIPPHDHPKIIAGQGTVGLEIAEQAAAIGAKLDAAVVPIGGGGLAAGMSIVLKEKIPDIHVYCSEPVGFDDTARSLRSGNRERTTPGANSFCDALLTSMPGEITFAINRNTLSGGFVVTDEEVATAMEAAFTNLKLVVEPGGAVALAALLSGKLDVRGKTVVVVCSGGNVDRGTFCAAIARR